MEVRLPPYSVDDARLLNDMEPQKPALSLVWRAVVEVGEGIDLGPARGGHRFLVPITGGRFYAGPAGAGLNGTVLPGGADRQFLRSDGIKELDALYEMKCEDGTIITVRNRVIVDPTVQPNRYAMSVIDATAEAGKFDWLNRRILLGTLTSARPARACVVIGAWLAA